MGQISFFEVKEDWEREIINSNFKDHEIKIFEESINDVEINNFKDSDIISVFIYSRVNKELIEKLPNLKLITTRSTGFDHIDINEAKNREILVANVPFYGQNTVAEYNFAHLLNISRKLCQSISRVKSGSFDFTGLRGFDLAEKKVGILGFGHIGQKFAKMCIGFEMKVYAYDVNSSSPGLIERAREIGAKLVDLDTIYKECDIISLHLPLLDSTKHILNENSFSKMKDGVVILNPSRGDLIDSKALIEALNSNKVFAAGLDVLEGECLIKEEIVKVLEEPREKECNFKTLTFDHILINHPRVFVTPHNAFNTIDALKRILNTTIYNINQYLYNGNLKENQVK
jgi:D-lactate dehydrogenase